MAEDNVKAQMRKGILEYCILAILSREDSFAPKIIAELKQAEMIVVEGTLYPILTRQKNAGLLTYRWEESPQGPPRKYYTLTDKGRERAQYIFERHKCLTKIFTLLGVNAETAAEDACRVEHYISDETFQALKRHLAEHENKTP